MKDTTPEDFELFLSWLNPNRDEAGLKYEEIRKKLIKILVCRGCPVAEDLADETIRRVILKVKSLTDFEGDVIAYFIAVLNNVYREYRKTRDRIPEPPVVTAPFTNEEHGCLEHCLSKLHIDDNKLILDYHGCVGSEGGKVSCREGIADRLGISVKALRIRACRIRAVLEKCIEDCLQGPASDEIHSKI